MKSFQWGCILVVSCVLAAACDGTPTEPLEPASISASGSLPTSPSASVTIAPAVIVRDAAGRPVAGATVTFQVTEGGGSVSSNTATTNGSGVASRPWTLGPEPSVNTIVASVGSLAPVSLSVTTCAVFCIDIRYVGSVSAAHQAAFTNAALRWQDIITGDLPAVALNIPAGDCKDNEGNTLVDHPAINETIDDLLVYVAIEEIDGRGQVLGSAGPCYIRGTSRLPLFGIMRFDVEDLDTLQASGLLHDVILHELGHVLGFPAIWKDSVFDLLEGEGTDNPYFTGSNTASRFQLAGGTLVNGVGVPVENAGGDGTRDSHWRESVFRSELMSGFISTGHNPLSVITIASMQDIGYQVDFGAADAYVLPGQGGPGGLSSVRSARLEMIERPLAPPRVVY